jgi:hypothetical protein
MEFLYTPDTCFKVNQSFKERIDELSKMSETPDEIIYSSRGKTKEGKPVLFKMVQQAQANPSKFSVTISIEEVVPRPSQGTQSQIPAPLPLAAALNPKAIPTNTRPECDPNFVNNVIVRGSTPPATPTPTPTIKDIAVAANGLTKMDQVMASRPPATKRKIDDPKGKDEDDEGTSGFLDNDDR